MNLFFLSLCFFMPLLSMQEHQSDSDDYEYIEFDSEKALKQARMEEEADYAKLPNLPLVILSDHCPVCQYYITLEESIILDACTKDQPGITPHIFHKSCLQVAYAVYPECPLCHRPIDESEIFTKNIPQTVWYYSKKIICGIPYGLIIGATARVGYEITAGTIRISAEVLKALLLKRSHNPVSQALSLFMPVSQPLDMVISAGSTYIMIKGLSAIPAEKRYSFLLSLLQKTGISS